MRVRPQSRMRSKNRVSLNMPRTQVTICGAPKAIAMPTMAPIHQPHDIRLAIAIPPNTITKIMAIGVSHARMLVCRAFAPVRNGENCARTCSGNERTASGGIHRKNDRSHGRDTRYIRAPSIEFFEHRHENTLLLGEIHLIRALFSVT